MGADDLFTSLVVIAWLGLVVAIPVTAVTRKARRQHLLEQFRSEPMKLARNIALSTLVWLALVVALGWMILGTAVAGKRSPAARAAFVQQNPCPATGKARGACPGYVVDHVSPLVCGGQDQPSNMQWQTTADAREKDRWERRDCDRRSTR